MKQYRKVVSLLLCIGIVCAFLTACTAQEEQSSEQDPDNPAIARVNGKEILLSEYKEQEAFVVDFLGEDVSEEVKEQIQESLLETLIENEIVAQKAEELGLSEWSEEERQILLEDTLNQRREEIKEELQSQGESIQEAEIEDRLQQDLEEQGYEDEQALAEDLVEQETYQRLYDYTVADVSVSKEEIEEYYNETLAQQKQTEEEDHEQALADYFDMTTMITLYVPEGIRYIKHIFVPFSDEDIEEISSLMQAGEDTVDAETQAFEKIRPTMDEIRERLEEGEDFDALMQEYGQDENMTSGDYPDGYPTAQGAGVPEEWLQEAFALEEPGDISGIVVMSDGCSILQYVGDVPAGEVPLENAEDEIREILLTEKQEATWQETLDAWKEELNVEILEENIQ